MKKVSDTYKKLGIDFSFPIEIKDANGNETYYEYSDGFGWKREYDAKGNETYYETHNGYWHKCEYDSKGNRTYYEDSDGYWHKCEYDSKGNRTYYESSDGEKKGTPRGHACTGKVIKIDGRKYKLMEL